jgi:hypothetical protein
MSMFRWMPEDDNNDDTLQDKNSSRVVSSWFWLYWAITVPLTIGILILWVIWFKRADRRYQERQDSELDEENKIE